MPSIVAELEAQNALLRRQHEELRDAESAAQRQLDVARRASAAAWRMATRSLLQAERRGRLVLAEWEAHARQQVGSSMMVAEDVMDTLDESVRGGTTVGPLSAANTLRTDPNGATAQRPFVAFCGEEPADSEAASSSVPPGEEASRPSGDSFGAVTPDPPVRNPNVIGDHVVRDTRHWLLCESIRVGCMQHVRTLEEAGVFAHSPTSSNSASNGRRNDDEVNATMDGGSALGRLTAAFMGRRRKRRQQQEGPTPAYHCYLAGGVVEVGTGTSGVGRLGPLDVDCPRDVLPNLSNAFAKGVALQALQGAARPLSPPPSAATEDDTPRTESPASLAALSPTAAGGELGLDEQLPASRPETPQAKRCGAKDTERVYGRARSRTTVESGPSPLSSGTASPTSSGSRVARPDEVTLHFHAEPELQRARAHLGVSASALQESLGSSASDWRRAVSPGKSEASFLYFGHFVAKGVSEEEFGLLTSGGYLERYAEHTRRHPYTLLPHFAALFTVTWARSGRRTRFVVMNNVFRTGHFIQKVYDLKGSSVGRDGIDAETGQAAKHTSFGAALLKDNDLPERLIVCGSMRRAILVAQVQADAQFLESMNIIDYSFLVGVRSRTVAGGPARPAHRHVRTTSYGQDASGDSVPGIAAGRAGAGRQRRASVTLFLSPSPTYLPDDPAQQDGRCLRCHDGGLVSLPIHESGSVQDVREDTFYFGLIDVLQPYSGAKRLETMAKGLFHDPAAISVVAPQDFAQRLCKMVERITA